MKLLLLVCAATLSFACAAAAQETPHYEVFVGGSALRAHTSGTELNQLLNLPAPQFQPPAQSFNLFGWDASVVENVNSWFGAELDASGFYGSPGAPYLFPEVQLLSATPNFSHVPVTTHMQTFLFGPRISWRKYRTVVFFAHMPVGIGFTNSSLNEWAVVASVYAFLPPGKLKSSTGLALAPGAGIDVRLNARLMLRPIQIDYLMTHFFGERQDNIRVSAGVNLTFGEK